MITKEEVNLWWLKGPSEKDPRGKPRSFFDFMFSYKQQKWATPLDFFTEHFL